MDSNENGTRNLDSSKIPAQSFLIIVSRDCPINHVFLRLIMEQVYHRSLKRKKESLNIGFLVKRTNLFRANEHKRELQLSGKC